MPVSRWWEFEDGQVNLGSVDAGPEDLLRILLLGFALRYGNDWFLVPLELTAGAVYRVVSLIVTDSFGQRTLVRPYTQIESPGARWRMFSLSSDVPSAGDESLLFIPNSLPASLRGDPIEEVRLLRDEVANLAWAVERLVEDAGGRPVDRFEQYQRTRPDGPDAAPAADGNTRYRLATSVPDYWLPLVPMRVDSAQPDLRLVRGRVLLEGGSSAVTPAPLGRLLEPGRPLALFEEEVPRAGAQLVRRYEMRARPTAAVTSGSRAERVPGVARAPADYASIFSYSSRRPADRGARSPIGSRFSRMACCTSPPRTGWVPPSRRMCWPV